MEREYIRILPNAGGAEITTHHTYYSALSGSLKSHFYTIQTAPFWQNICPPSLPFSGVCPVVEMNEIYYSNPRPNFGAGNLYCAAANFIPHRDCILYNFAGIHFYRVIIGITENNHDVATEFIEYGLEHRLNKGDYMAFDFDKTLHQVKKTGDTATPRILLKLHFIVCDDIEHYGENYVEIITWFYKMYYFIARYTEQIGTDPTTFAGFFYGLMWECPFSPFFPLAVASLSITSVAISTQLCDSQVCVLTGSIVGVWAIYLMVVLFFTMRFWMTGIK
jgi:hypothetical protein